MAAQPAWHLVLRALREARGVTQDGWATRLGYSRRTLVRWEQGTAVPNAVAETALVALCAKQGLFHRYEHGPLAGQELTADWLVALLTAARTDRPQAEPSEQSTRVAGPTTPPTNLPSSLTSFLGREQELADLAVLLADNRLVTLTGPGGTGKTRLAVEAARRAATRFPDGVWFVDLSGLTDIAGVLPAIALALGVRETESRPLAVSLAAFMRRKHGLLVLDNFEQVVAAAMRVYDLAVETPDLVVLITSRVLLRIEGEREYAVPPLPLPEHSAGFAPEQLGANPAVQLFVERAQVRRPDFRLSSENAAAVAAICTRLDGLPLAIELAAAWVKLLSPVQLLARLEQRLVFLTGGERNRPARQQTLRNTLQWSWDLLPPAEQVLFRRLGVFDGGWTLDAAETVCNFAGELDVLEGLAALVDQSLVQQQDDPRGGSRFHLLATLQEFALEQLDASGEARTLRLRHAEYCCALAEVANTTYVQGRRYATIQALFVERANLLGALVWLLAVDEGELGLRLAAALAQYWFVQDSGAGLHWVETFLARAGGDVPAALRGAGHAAAAWAACAFGVFGVALGHAEYASVLLSGTTAQAELAQALAQAALIRMPSDASRARLEVDEALRLARASRVEAVISYVAYMAALALQEAQHPIEALPLAEEAYQIARHLDSDWLTGASVWTLGVLAQRRGDLQAAHRYAQDVLPRVQLDPGSFDAVNTLALLAFCEAAGGETGALATWQACLAASVAIGNLPGMVSAVLGIAEQLAIRGKPAEATRLLGAVAAYVERTYASPFRIWAEPSHEQAHARTHAALTAETFAQAWAAGQALSLDRASDLALAAPFDRNDARPVSSRPRVGQ